MATAAMKKMLFAGGSIMLASHGAWAALRTTWDVGDYVQDGLVAHYDAIRNAGANLPHDSDATVWADISPNGTAGAATMHLGAANHEYGTWTSNAFSTSGWMYFQMANAIALGGEFTIQIACDVDKAHRKAGVDNYPCPFACGEFSIFLARSSAATIAATNLTWKTDEYGGNTRPSMA